MNNIVMSRKLNFGSIKLEKKDESLVLYFDDSCEKTADGENKIAAASLTLAQIRLKGDSFNRNYSGGLTMLESQSSRSLKFCGIEDTENGCNIRFENEKIEYYSIIRFGDKTIETSARVINKTNEPLFIEAMPSVTIGGINPAGDEDIKVHRFVTRWSAEGRHVTDDIYRLGLENSWASGWGGRYYRFGAAGSMPVRGYHPFLALEDCRKKTTVAIYLEAAASWQLELARVGTSINISGGLADADTGNFCYKLNPGAEFVTPRAYLTYCRGGFENAANILMHHLAQNIPQNKQEESLPVIYNEYCHTWGQPTRETVETDARLAAEAGAEYFVIDAGWYRRDGVLWNADLGHWQAGNCFYGDMKPSAELISSLNMKAGIWFEPEMAGEKSKFYEEKKGLIFAGDKPLINVDRAFFDFRDKETAQYLRERVIDFCKLNGFSYAKLDYNDAIGTVVDGQTLFDHIEKVQEFYTELRNSQDNFVLEVCSSGGHRVTPSWLGLANMVSFSDAHEGHEGAIVALNLHYLAPPRQLQIWSVVNDILPLKEIRYRMGQSFLGRMCISGDLSKLTYDAKKTITDAVSMYKKCRNIISCGDTYRIGKEQKSYLKPHGFQAALRIQEDNAMVVIHSFENAGEIVLNHKLLKDFVVTGCLYGDISKNTKAYNLKLNLQDFDCMVLLCKKQY